MLPDTEMKDRAWKQGNKQAQADFGQKTGYRPERKRLRKNSE